MENQNSRIPLWVSLPASVYLWVVLIFWTILLSSIGVLVGMPLSLLLDRGSRAIMHRVAVVWGRGFVYLNPFWRVTVEGLENIDRKKTYMIIANHQSMLDILMVLFALPIPFRFLAKRELFTIPFLGWHISLAGYIPLDRSSKESGRKALQTSVSWLRRGVSMIFYPEGTRSLDGRIKMFKPGAFRLAQTEDVAILPVVIEGTGDALPKKSRFIEKKTIFSISVGKPVSIQVKDDVEARTAAIREEMIQRLDKIRERRRG